MLGIKTNFSYRLHDYFSMIERTIFNSALQRRLNDSNNLTEDEITIIKEKLHLIDEFDKDFTKLIIDFLETWKNKYNKDFYSPEEVDRNLVIGSIESGKNLNGLLNIVNNFRKQTDEKRNDLDEFLIFYYNLNK